MEIRKLSIGEILGIIISVLTIAASFGFFVSYVWHKTWFETIGLPIDLSWIKSELGIISLLNIGYILLYLIFALFSVLSFYLIIRGIEKLIPEKYLLQLYENIIVNKKSINKKLIVIFIVSIILILLIYYLYPLYPSIFIILLLFIIPSFYLHTYLDQFFKKIRKDTNGTVYIWKDVAATLFLIVIFYIFYNPLIYLFLFLISIFSILSPLPLKNPSFKFWLIFIGFLFVFSFPIATLMDEARRDAEVAINRIIETTQNKSYEYNPTLPLYGLISSKSLQRGTVFLENIESVHDLICISDEEYEQKVLKDRCFISFGEIALVFTSKDKQINILILKDGKFLRAVKVNGV